MGNPGLRYQDTRHNVGAVFVAQLAKRYQIPMKAESRFKGELGRGVVAGQDVRLLLPTTFMNLSGESVGAVARFYQIAAEEILAARGDHERGRVLATRLDGLAAAEGTVLLRNRGRVVVIGWGLE